MRALVISDIHGNLPALEAVLAAAPAHDTVWNLGDSVGYGANPNEVVELARGLGGVRVRGNHDRACSGLMRFGEAREISQNAYLAIEWTQKTLTKENRSWLSKLPRGPVRLPKYGAMCVHGSPLNEDTYMVYNEDAIAALRTRRARIIFFGHTHLQGGWISNRLRVTPLLLGIAPGKTADRFEMSLRENFRYVLNPGSVGQPRDRDWRAAFAIFDDEQSLVTWHRVPYDVLETKRRILDAGLPEFLASRLSEGR
jgi:diadenosine tetraphosphatase ApaH/serine/threonine PP2A family protein phosphatase